MATITFDKTDPLCGNVYLIDEKLCLKNSYPIINSNVDSLSTSLRTLNDYSNQFFSALYNNFSSNSAKWITAINNWETLSARWINAETVVSTVSTYWDKEINLIYPDTIRLVDYYTSPTTYANLIINWLNQNVNNFFSENQRISVDLYLTHSFVFDWSFFYSYYEGCVPTTTSRTGTCNCPTPNHSCNAGTIDGRPFRGCTNAGRYCRINQDLTAKLGAENIFCPNFGAGTNTVNYQRNGSDKTIARTITLNFVKRNNIFTT
jgi:hypothetical protein